MQLVHSGELADMKMMRNSHGEADNFIEALRNEPNFQQSLLHHASVDRGYVSNRLSRYQNSRVSKGLSMGNTKMRFSDDLKDEEDMDVGMSMRMGDLASAEIGERSIRAVPKIQEPVTDTRCFCVRWFSSSNSNDNSALESRQKKLNAKGKGSSFNNSPPLSQQNTTIQNRMTGSTESDLPPQDQWKGILIDHLSFINQPWSRPV